MSLQGLGRPHGGASPPSTPHPRQDTPRSSGGSRTRWGWEVLWGPREPGGPGWIPEVQTRLGAGPGIRNTMREAACPHGLTPAPQKAAASCSEEQNTSGDSRVFHVSSEIRKGDRKDKWAASPRWPRKGRDGGGQRGPASAPPAPQSDRRVAQRCPRSPGGCQNLASSF